MRSIIILMAALGCVTAGQSRGAPQKAHHMVVPAMADSDENGMRLKARLEEGSKGRLSEFVVERP